jgi:hypothetical protein
MVGDGPTQQVAPLLWAPWYATRIADQRTVRWVWPIIQDVCRLPDPEQFPAIEQEELYEQISGGCLREVRLNVTLPAGESNLAVVGLMNTSVPRWKGLPQPTGGFPLPSDNGCLARQNVPSILAQWMPQCV